MLLVVRHRILTNSPNCSHVGWMLCFYKRHFLVGPPKSPRGLPHRLRSALCSLDAFGRRLLRDENPFSISWPPPVYTAILVNEVSEWDTTRTRAIHMSGAWIVYGVFYHSLKSFLSSPHFPPIGSVYQLQFVHARCLGSFSGLCCISRVGS